MDKQRVGYHVHNREQGEPIEHAVLAAVNRYRALYNTTPDTVLVPACSEYGTGKRTVGGVEVRVYRYEGVSEGAVWVGCTPRLIEQPAVPATVDNSPVLVESAVRTRPHNLPSEWEGEQAQVERANKYALASTDEAVIAFVEGHQGNSWFYMRRVFLRLRPDIAPLTTNGIKQAYWRAKKRVG